MRIAERYSHLNGWEHIQVHKPHLWAEIEDVIGLVDAVQCQTKESQEKDMLGRLLFSPKQINAWFKRELTVRGWREARTSYWVTADHRLIRKTLPLPADEQRREIEAEGRLPIRSYNQTDFEKERIAIEVQFGKYPFVAYDLFVKHMAFYVGDMIDVGVEILPVKAMQAGMSSGIAYYEGELYNVIRQGRGVPAVPLVVVGVAP